VPTAPKNAPPVGARTATTAADSVHLGGLFAYFIFAPLLQL
jgi:hypothetical protein